LPDPISIARSIGHAFAANLGAPRHYLGRSVETQDEFAQTGETVLLIHGFWQTHGVMHNLAVRLRADGYRVLNFDLGGFAWRFNTRGIPHIAKRIGSRLERMLERGDFGQLHVIGHSKGGLVGRYLVSRLGWHRSVSTLITLGTPHHGTPTAALGLVTGVVSRSVWQMLPHSSLLQEIHDHPLPEKTRLVSIYSRSDVVCPFRYSELSSSDGADVHNVVINGLGHMELVDDPWVYGLILRQLRPEEGGEGAGE
jgi:triacylglycerol lipase